MALPRRATAVMYDVAGKVIKPASLNDAGETRLFVSGVPVGIYYLKIYSENEVFTEKVIVAY